MLRLQIHCGMHLIGCPRYMVRDGITEYELRDIWPCEGKVCLYLDLPYDISECDDFGVNEEMYSPKDSNSLDDICVIRYVVAPGRYTIAYVPQRTAINEEICKREDGG